MTKLKHILFSLLMFVSVTLQAQSPTKTFRSIKMETAEGKTLKPNPQLTAKQIVDKYNQLQKAMEHDLKSIQIKYLLYPPNEYSGFPMYLAVLPKKKKQYAEMDLGNMVVKTGTNKEIEWELDPRRSKKPQIIKKKKTFISPFSEENLVEYQNNASEIEYVSRVYIGKQLCHKIALTTSKGEQFVYCINAATYVLVKNVNKAQKRSIYSLDYEKIGKHLFAKYSYVEAGDSWAIFKINKYIFNASIDEELFEPPQKKD